MTIGVFEHLTQCSPCERAAKEALRERFGVGAVDPAALVSASAPGGVPTLTPAASQTLSLLLAGRYPQQTGSGRIINGQAVNEPAFDPAGDYQTLVAAQQGEGTTVYESLKSLPPGAVALFDFQAIVSNLNGNPVDVPYAIAKNAQVAKTLAVQSSSVALSGGAGAVPEEKKDSKTPIIGGVVVGGVAFLATGNPIVGIASGVASGLLLSKVG